MMRDKQTKLLWEDSFLGNGQSDALYKYQQNQPIWPLNTLIWIQGLFGQTSQSLKKKKKQQHWQK